MTEMHGVVLTHQTDFDGWRSAARRLALRQVPPEQTIWSVTEATDLFAAAAAEGSAGAGQAAAGEERPAGGAAFSVPRALVQLAETVIQAREPARFGLLYALTWRIHRGERQLLDDAADPLVQRLMRLAAAVRRDTHKMRAFLRFREVSEDEGLRYVAWFEPDHYIVEANAGFFVRRFATLRWSILTPYRSLHWDGETVRLAPGASKAEVPDDDALEAYWRSYFSSIFNPARLKISAMMSEMPKKYWQNMPETAAIPELVRQAQERTQAMVEAAPMPRTRPEQKWPEQKRAEQKRAEQERAEPRPIAQRNGAAGVRDEGLLAGAMGAERSGRDVDMAALAASAGSGDLHTMESLQREAAGCRRCDLWAHATQTVFGEGPAGAKLMLIGEQPGDQEDLAGRPFVGPAGQLLDQALREAGIDRAAAYVTNAVKHFKFEPRGKRRIHATPDRTEIETCRFWLEREREMVRPAVTVILGASAARAVLGRAVTISRERGQAMPLPQGVGLVTVHPSYLLRLPDPEQKKAAYHAFVCDLCTAQKLLREVG